MNTSFVLDIDTIINFLLDIAHGMNYLHKSGILHEGLSTYHCFVDKNFRIKINNYQCIDLLNTVCKYIYRPSYFSSPEILQDPSLNSTIDNVYSFGIICWQLLFRKIPYNNVFNRTLAVQIVHGNLRPSIGNSIHKELIELMCSCWHNDISIRPEFSIIIEILNKMKIVGPPKLILECGINAARYQKAQTVEAFRSNDPITVLKDWVK
jgi:serine/threonine protein kinase